MSKRIFDLEDRLVNFAIMVLTLAEALPKRQGIKGLIQQLVRCGTSPALNYGEAQSAESPKDFLHKLRISLKELREAQICLKIIRNKPYMETRHVEPVLQECSELVAIFTASIETKKRNIRLDKAKGLPAGRQVKR